jgi:hypothetical protein
MWVEEALRTKARFDTENIFVRPENRDIFATSVSLEMSRLAKHKAICRLLFLPNRVSTVGSIDANSISSYEAISSQISHRAGYHEHSEQRLQ